MKMNRDDPWGGYIQITTIAAIVFAVFLSALAAAHYTTIQSIDDVTIESISYDALLPGYIIMTTNGVFTNRSNILLGKFEIESLHEKLQVGRSCSFEFNLLDLEILDMKRNILSADCK